MVRPGTRLALSGPDPPPRARRELERGIQWGPANEVAREIVHVAEPQREGLADVLHPLGVNCFVREPRGIALVAARTLSRDTQWRQLSVRRLMLSLMSVTSLPRLDALVTSRRLSSGSSSLHL